MRWLVVFLLAFLVFNGLSAWLRKLGLGPLINGQRIGRAELVLGELLLVLLISALCFGIIFAASIFHSLLAIQTYHHTT